MHDGRFPFDANGNGRLPGNKILAVAVEDKADDIRTRRALEQAAVLRGYTQTNYAAHAWKVERRVCARIEATEPGLDIRYVVTNMANGSPEYIYDTLYCARGQMENLIKLHRASWRLTALPVVLRSPIRCGLFCIQPPVG